jgi:hypothetical protein
MCMSFFLWTTHWAINGLTSRFHFEVFASSYPFQHALRQDIWNPSCSNLIMFRPWGGCMFYISTNLPSLLIIFPILLHNVPNMIWRVTSFNSRYPLMCVHTSHQCYKCPVFMSHPRQWAHEHPWCSLRLYCCHYTRWWLPCGMGTTICTFLNHVVFTKDEICTLADVVIIDPTWANLLHRSCAIWRFTTFKTAQAKERNYYDWHPTDHFFPLTIEVFGCLNKQVDVFLHDCANAMWNFKGLKGLHVYVLITFLCQKISITLQRMQASAILSWVIAIGVTTSQLPPLQNAFPHHHGWPLTSN